MILVTVNELKRMKARDFPEGEIIGVGKYFVHIGYAQYSRHPLKTYVSTQDGNVLDCTPGVRGGWPYYIADFINR